MEKFVKGDVVVILFPFSDLSSAKKRPAVVVANLIGKDIILAQITSAVSRNDQYAISLDEKDFSSGKLHIPSLIRLNKLFTADVSIISSKVGSLKIHKTQEVKNSLCNIFSQ